MFLLQIPIFSNSTWNRAHVELQLTFQMVSKARKVKQANRKLGAIMATIDSLRESWIFRINVLPVTLYWEVFNGHNITHASAEFMNTSQFHNHHVSSYHTYIWLLLWLIIKSDHLDFVQVTCRYLWRRDEWDLGLLWDVAEWLSLTRSGVASL